MKSLENIQQKSELKESLQLLEKKQSEKRRETLVLDSSKLSTYLACPKKFQLSHVKNLKPIKEAIFYDFGKAIHVGFEHYFQNDKNLDAGLSAIDAYVKENDFTPIDDPKEHRTPDTARMVLIEYNRRFASEPIVPLIQNDKKLIEVTFSFPVDIFETENCIYDVLYAGKIDMICAIGKTNYIMDHKHTSSKKPTWYLKYQYPNDQMAGYIFAENVYLDFQVMGVCINLVHVTKTKIDFEKRVISYTKEQLEEWFKNLHFLAERIVNDIDQNTFPRYSTSCYSMYGGCSMLQVCSNPVSVRKAIIEMDFKVQEWNPLAREETNGQEDI